MLCISVNNKNHYAHVIHNMGNSKGFAGLRKDVFKENRFGTTAVE